MVFMMIESQPSQKFIDLSDEMTESFLKYTGVAQYRKLCFAVHELVINAVEAAMHHQHVQRREGREGTGREDGKTGEMSGCTVSVRMELNEGDIVITITNNACRHAGQTIGRRSQMKLEELLYEERGRGLLLAKRLSDQLTYEQDDSGRMTIELRKKGGNQYEEIGRAHV